MRTYFPVVPNEGISRQDELRGLGRYIKDHGLNLAVDVFLPHSHALYGARVRSSDELIAPIRTHTALRTLLRSYADRSWNWKERCFYRELLRQNLLGKVGIYLLNQKRIKKMLKERSSEAEDRLRDCLVVAFEDFLEQGHIITSRQSIAGHACVIDSVRSKGSPYFRIFDPGHVGGRIVSYEPFTSKEFMLKYVGGYDWDGYPNIIPLFDLFWRIRPAPVEDEIHG